MTRIRLCCLAAVVGAAVALGCGEGRVILNVDVLSFIGDQGRDTVHYTVPGGATVTIDNPPVEVTLLKGLGNSTVDSVTLTVGANVENQTGGGKVKFQIFFAGSQAGVYSGTPYAQDSAIVSGADTALLLPAPVPLVGDSIFGQNQIFVGVRLVVTANPPLLPAMDGKLRLSTVRLRIILQENVF
ncbi:MAG: hypothetical protein ACREMW_14830 [Gemmatimonadales bacterium]